MVTMMAARTTDWFGQEELRRYRQGEAVFLKGEVARHMFAVQAGEVELWLDGRLCEVVGPGGVFGEMALVNGQPRTANAIARTDCLLAVLDEPRFALLVQQTPAFALGVMRALTDRLLGWHRKAFSSPLLAYRDRDGEKAVAVGK